MPYIGRAPTSTATKLEDADQDTKIQVEESSDEDTIRFDIAGAEDFTMTANTFTALSGSTIATNTIAETTGASGVTIDGLLIKDSTAAFADGAVATPSITNTGDLNTGVYFPAADTVGVVAGGVEQFRFGSNPIPGGGGANLLINGSMAVAQRGTVTGLGATNYVYFLDGWCHYAGYGSAIRYTASQDNSAGTTADSGWSLKIDITTANTATTANLASAVIQKIEGQNLQHLQYGSANAKATTLSFWVSSPKSGSHCVALYANDGNRSCPIEYTVASADTWEKISVTFPGDTGATVPPNDSTPYIHLVFPLHTGSTYEGTAGSWQSGEKYATSSTVNIGDDAANNFYLTDVQLEVGSVATDFAHEDVGTTLQKCQRYYERVDLAQVSGEFFMNGYAYSTTFLVGVHHYRIKKRAAPTITFSAAATWRNFHENTNTVCSGIGVQSAASVNSVGVYGQVGSGLTAGNGGTLSRDATDTTFIEISSEL